MVDFVISAVMVLSFMTASAAQAPLYKQPGAPIDDRVKDLVARMNMTEKLNQMTLPFGAHYPEDYAGYNISGLGATYPLPGGVSVRNAWQSWQVNHTRLGIPTSFISETLHSGYSKGTIYPMPCLQGSTWNPALVEAAGSGIAFEASASGVDRGFSPVLHFCTDPRFGRCEESFGEDPALVSTMGVAAVTGLSGKGSAGAANTYMADPTTKIATEAKHYAAYGYGGRDGSMSAEISQNTLYDVYLKPWRAYAQAGGRGIMAAHNDVDGMPCHGNKELIDALRNTFGFAGGLCASDAGDVSSISSKYKVARSQMEAGAVALNAGMDQDLEYPGAFQLLDQALAAGLVNMSQIDNAVGNVLRQKFAAGLFDNRDDLLLVDPVKQAAALDTPEHRALARTIAEEGIVMLTNDNVLPLPNLGSGGLKNVAVIGPNADNEHSTQGGYTEGGATIVTVLDGIVNAANASNNSFTVQYERGSCLGATPECDCPIPSDPTVAPCGIANTSRISMAADVVAAADLTILVIGDSSTILAGDEKLHHETGTCGEHFDRDNLDPAGAQLDLLKAVLATAGKKVIVVLIHGRTVTFGASPSDGANTLISQAGAVLAAWRPGEEAGNAIMSIINGTVNPSGRSAHTWPRTVGMVHQYVPWFLERGTRPTSNAYADMAPATPLFPFGYGLSYTNYTFNDVSIDKTNVSADDTFEVNVHIDSTGMAGKVVIQVYFSQDYASRVRFDKMLLGFNKVEVPANSKGFNASATLKVKDFEMWDKTTKDYIVEPGSYTIFVGQHSEDPNMKSLSINVV